ncbi:MAG: N-acetylglucosamine-6-phosphate deacetylase [Thermomicrobiales bacterium]|nr:N-acetylglucosamine-6-phosphate deacetylase [Thermomicrobiales bacterium]
MSAIAFRGHAVVGTHTAPSTIIAEDGVITSIQRTLLSDGNLPDTVIDADLISPGLIDLQVNGAYGAQIDDDPAHIDLISERFLETGVTAWLPTVVTSAAETYPPICEAWKHRNPDAGAVPLGFHLEGPFLTLEKKGAHKPEFILAASEELFQSWLEQDSIALVTLSPEREGNLPRIRQMVDAGILVSLGHTNATYEEFIAGIDAGARKATHLFNAMTAIHHREPGAMVATMVDERVTAGLIPDGIHSHPATVRLAIAAKGFDGIVIVSDMMAATGLGPGTYPLGTMNVIVDETSARLADGTLAGSILTIDQALRNLVDWSECTPAQGIHMMTAVPARLLNDERRGRLVVGARADITTWNRDLQPTSTTVAGEVKWRVAE